MKPKFVSVLVSAILFGLFAAIAEAQTIPPGTGSMTVSVGTTLTLEAFVNPAGAPAWPAGNPWWTVLKPGATAPDNVGTPGRSRLDYGPIDIAGTWIFTAHCAGSSLSVAVVAIARPTVTSITVETTLEQGGVRDTRARGMTFKAKITIQGTGLDNLEIRQLIRSSTTWKDWNGQNMTVNQIMQDGGIPAWQRILISTGGQFVTDINWGWQALRNRNAQNTQAVHYDDQAHNVTNAQVTIGGVVYTQVRRAEITRELRIQIRDKGTRQVIATHDWSFRWSNDNAEWTQNHNPQNPVPNCAGGHIGTGDFNNVNGIQNLPW